MKTYFHGGFDPYVAVDGNKPCPGPKYWLDTWDNMWRQRDPRYDFVHKNSCYTPECRPYNFSEYYLFNMKEKNTKYEAVYSDRMNQWDYEKFKRALDIVGSGMDWFDPNKAEKFMSAYYGRAIEVAAMARGCNQSSGYPYFIFWFRDKPVDNPIKKEKKTKKSA